MKFTIARFLPILIVIIAVSLLSSCGGPEKDEKGRLLLSNLKSSSGSLSFRPMLRSDSASVNDFSADIFSLKDKPYSGPVAHYNEQKKLLIEGNFNEGVMDGEWTFYFASGGVQAKGVYKNGLETGVWTSYYGYDKPKIVKLYDDYGYPVMRKEYYDNGKLKLYENVKSPDYGDVERKVAFSKGGTIEFITVEPEHLEKSADELIAMIESGAFGK